MNTQSSPWPPPRLLQSKLYDFTLAAVVFQSASVRLIVATLSFRSVSMFVLVRSLQDVIDGPEENVCVWTETVADSGVAEPSYGFRYGV